MTDKPKKTPRPRTPNGPYRPGENPAGAAECLRCNAQIPEGNKLCANCAEELGGLTNETEPFENQPFSEGRYFIRKRIGSGGYGNIYVAEEREEKRRLVALKILHFSHVQDPEMVARFWRECEVTRRLQHEAAVKVFDHFQRDKDEIPWMAMELLRGKTLAEYLEDKMIFLNKEEFLGIIRPICEVLAEAHSQGIIHRDIKPRNIMLVYGPDGKLTPKVFDFGIAASADGEPLTLTSKNIPLGTPKYMSPEHWEGLRHTDQRSDIYSLGLIAYQMLSRGYPFEEAEGLGSWMKTHKEVTPRPLRDWMYANSLPWTVEAVVMRAIAKNPEERYQTILEFKQDLERAFTDSKFNPEETLRSNASPIEAHLSSSEQTLSTRSTSEHHTLKREAAKLYVLTPPFEWTYSLVYEKTRIGRSPDNDIVLEHHTVSRAHVEIVQQSNGLYCIYDLTGRGVEINGTRYPVMYLRDQDKIFLGDICLRFVCSR